MGGQEAARRPRVEPGGAQREGADLALERRPDDRPARRDEYLLDDVGLALDLDDLAAALAGDEGVALAHAGAVGADLLDEEVGRVDERRRDAPGGEAVVAGADRRPTDQRGAGDGPTGCADLGQVPVRRQRRLEVGVVGEERPARRGARAGDGPVVRAAVDAGEGREGGTVRRKAVDGGAGEVAGRGGDGVVVGIIEVEGGERLGAVRLDDLEPRELDVPVADQQKRDELADAEDVGGVPRRRPGAQEDELVGERRGGEGGVDAAGEGLGRGADVGVEDGELALRRLAEADAAREAVNRQRLAAEESGQGTAQRAQAELELHGAVLALAEAEAEPGVLVVRRVYIGDGVAVAAYDEALAQAGQNEVALRGGQAPAEGEGKEASSQIHRRVR